MSWLDLQALTPVALPALAATAVMLAGALGAGRRALHTLALAGAAASLGSVAWMRPLVPRQVTALLRVDGTAVFFLVLIYAAVGLLMVVSRPYLVARARDPETFYTLLLFATTGMGVLACADHFASFFLGLETLTVALYALIGYLKETPASLEAALKYLVLAALASGFLLFGIALLYAASGTLQLTPAVQAVAAAASSPQRPESGWAIAGALLLLVGFGFKLAIVPFHTWSPDVYQGAPAPVTALIATGSKGAVLAVLLRAFVPSGLVGGPVLAALAALAVATMFAGNLLALLQEDLKRLLAYSSVAHVGYVLVAVVAGGTNGAEAVALYVLVYVAMTLGAFAVVTVLSSESRADADNLRAYRGLGRRRPFLAGTLTLMLLSLAGIPPTGGFLAKFAVLGAAIDAGRGRLAVAMALASGLALFYYLRVVVVMFLEETPPSSVAVEPGAAGESPPATRRRAVPIGSAVALAALSIAVLAIGVWPSPWLAAVTRAVAGLLIA